jgi:thioester reductase-like protein
VSGGLLLTGGTGFLGMELIGRLLEAGDGPDIFLAVRARDGSGARARVDEIVARLYDNPPESVERLRPVAAELTAPGLAIGADDRAELIAHVDRVVHCAASISFTLPIEEAREINVQGTQGVMDLARQLPRLERLVHVSTAYVAGRAPTFFAEDDIGGRDFRNTYEQTKLEAEIAVAAADDLPSAIVRPSIVVGESETGWTSAFNVLYWPLQAFTRGLLATVPADPDGVVDMVPVDHVAEVIERATFAPEASGRYHAVAGERAPTVAELIEEVCRLMDRKVPALSEPGTLPIDHPAGVFAAYFDVKTRFDDRRGREIAGAAPGPFEYLPRLLEFAREARWGKRTISREAARLRAGVGAAQTAST